MSTRIRVRGLVILSLVVAVVASVATLRGRGQNTSTSQDGPTLIRRSTLTQRQREHAKLFKNKGVGNIYDLIQKMADEGDSGEINVESLPGTPELSQSGEPAAPSDQLATNAAQSDAVVIGVVSGKTSQLNEAETFVFTDYGLSVIEVLKNNGAAPISRNGAITVTRPGGAVQIEGRIVRAVDRTAKPLKVGEKYLLFLRYLPETGAYLASDGPSSFKLEGGKVLTLTEDPRYADFQKGRDEVSLVNDVHAAVSASVERKERKNE
jgi:hypothetical protein